MIMDIPQLDMHKVFREKLKDLSREELLEIIKEQNPKYIREINRIEYVFKNKLSHINDAKGNPITERTVTNEELALLIDPPFIYSKDLAKLGFNEEQQRQYHIASDPVLWAKTFLTVRPRAYQVFVLRDPSVQKVLRFGRRLGKTVTLSLFALWYCYTHQEGKILVAAPMKTHVGLIYDEMLNMIDKAAKEKTDLLSESVKRAVASPQYEINFKNGASIKFFSTGMKSNNKTNVARGQEADVIMLDEMDYMGPEDLVALFAMLQKTNEDKVGEKMLIGASTPSGLRETFWRWNTDPEEGFKAFYFPSYVNPNWTAEEEKRQRKRYVTEVRYQQEIEADFGEPAEGVYPRKYVDRAFADNDWKYDLNLIEPEAQSHYVMGVDWDKVGAGVNLIILEICGKNHTDEKLAGRSRVIFREEINKGEFTYTAAVDRIIKLNEYFNLNHIYVDRGAGEVQIELLHKHGINHPESGLQTKVKGYQFRENIEVSDPYNLQPQKKPIKAFMVDNLYRMFEDQKLLVSENDDELYFQIISYVVLKRSAYGEPIYGPGGGAVDHAHDALILACLAAQQNYDDFLQVKYASKPKAVSNETFLPLFAVNEKKDKELIEELWDSPSSAPILRKRKMINNRTASRGRRPIKRPMIR